MTDIHVCLCASHTDLGLKLLFEVFFSNHFFRTAEFTSVFLWECVVPNYIQISIFVASYQTHSLGVVNTQNNIQMIYYYRIVHLKPI